VWLARDETTGLDVALKVIPREGRMAARAEREAGVAARLRHVRCQRIYERASDQGHVYIAYEYVPGCTLREAMRAGRLNDRDAIEAAAQILDGLAYAHGHGVVHRDVKPANVLLADEPEVSIRLLDFGLARFAEADTLTDVGDVPGTLAYIAPERLRGEPATPASDVWAVGVLLWEALAERHPFWAASLPATAEKIEQGAPSLAKARPDLPQGLVQLVGRTLHSDPARRPAASELASRLRSVAAARRRAPVREADQGRGPGGTGRFPRLIPAALAALFAGWTAAAIPFYPAAGSVLLALAAGLLTFFRPRAGLALALVVPILPLGNASLGLALLYGALAAVWFLFHLRKPSAGLAFAAGPLLAPLGLLALLPLLFQPVRGNVRRAIQAAAAVLVAAIVAGIRGAALPFTGAAPPSLGLDATESPFVAARALLHALSSQPALGLEALILTAAAVACPFALRRGVWGIAGFGAALLAATLLAAPDASALPLVAAAWLTCAVLLVQDRGLRLPSVGVARLRME
jgi:hypothetical protein